MTEKCRHDDKIAKLMRVLPPVYLGWDILDAAIDYIDRANKAAVLLKPSRVDITPKGE